ncbi:MAG TPA: DUF4349 domain-containing protein [Pyrinomonadaceae bacterium]|nr:DUF4349 domain-containing protein [Pyrinomonadaceae bacterium]
MRLAAALSILISLAVLAGCAGAENAAPEAGGNAERTASTAGANPPQDPATPGGATTQKVSLEQADASQGAPAAAERKIIRNAALKIEVDSPADAQRRVASVAEQRGGYVVSSQSTQHGGSNDTRPYDVVTLELRVPSAHFDAAVGEIRGVGGRVVEEKTTGQDVTEEYIDLEARSRTQRALESQLLEIMKGANRVSDALEVQRELANVRTEIERLEGRRRFLENQSSLSTIRVTLQPPAPLVSSSAGGFFYEVRRALGDGVDIAVGVLLVLIRLVIALIPILLFIVLPLYLLARFVRRRWPRRPPPPPAATTAVPPAA